MEEIDSNRRMKSRERERDRLPVKTLRCTNVCKLWYSLITSPEFIYFHLNFAADSKNLAPNFLLLKRLYYVHTIIMQNPFIRRSIILQKPNLIYNSYGTFVQSLGFGFRRITNVDCAREHPQVELYKLSTGVWQDLSHLALDSIHWISCCKNCYDLIVLFNIYYEVFRSMKFPWWGPPHGMDPNNLVMYKESLALMSWNVSGPKPSFCIWVMNEYGIGESWSKHFSFDSHVFGVGFMRPLRVVGLLHSVSYDDNGVEVKDLGIHGSSYEDYRRSIHVDSYQESFVLLEGNRCFFYTVTCYKLPTLHTNNSDL
ncbi:hypothetical protein CDL12_03808 [Handroanthus impetiginosus]|uniref:Uncharacterized protein n=1 Tax=Handroanthus impetiginosus TaxID=429701 RepID=A0A2G9I144_9LAMI|nr:hypothetical protein CDL12_03808 [Handroanthus impetiginosus]